MVKKKAKAKRKTKVAKRKVAKKKVTTTRKKVAKRKVCLLYTSPSPRDGW